MRFRRQQGDGNYGLTWLDVIIGLTLIVGVGFILTVEAAESFDILTLKQSETGEEITINFCNSPGQSGPEWQHTLQVLEFPPTPGQVPTYEYITNGPAVPWVLTPTRAGLYFIRARSCTGLLCSVWGISITQADDIAVCVPDPQNVLWFFKLATPTGGGIE